MLLLLLLFALVLAQKDIPWKPEIGISTTAFRFQFFHSSVVVMAVCCCSFSSFSFFWTLSLSTLIVFLLFSIMHFALTFTASEKKDWEKWEKFKRKSASKAATVSSSGCCCSSAPSANHPHSLPHLLLLYCYCCCYCCSGWCCSCSCCWCCCCFTKLLCCCVWLLLRWNGKIVYSHTHIHTHPHIHTHTATKHCLQIVCKHSKRNKTTKC